MLETMLMELASTDYTIAYLVGEIIGILFTIVCFVFKGLAIRYMAKQNGLKKLWLSFVPFANFYLLGKVLGKAIVWGKPIKNVGLWVAIISGVQFVLNTLLSLGNISYYLESFGYTVEYTSKFVENWANGEGWLYTIVSFLSMGVDIVYIFFYVSLVFLTFRKYNPQRAFAYAIISIFLDNIFGILLFVSRKNKPFSYEDYLRAQQRSYYGGGYYVYRPDNTQAPNSGEAPKQPEDPFPEFENKDDNNSDNFFN
ncbi:MAG: hypothetical protein IKV61_02105 [Clostridia bacterium]|nr:hypothetical protein [Clostridia bacterium]